MARYDLLRVSLLAALTACGPGGPGGTGESSGTSESSGTTGGECVSTCENPMSTAEGFVECADGAVNRVAIASYDPTISAAACVGDETNLSCTTDADCTTGGPNGKCTTYTDPFVLETGCSCTYACASDEDCDTGEACIPPGIIEGTPDWPTCQPADCTTNDDCGECGECGLGAYDDGCGYAHQLACRTDADQCRASSSCGADFEDCYPDAEGAWICQQQNCDIGRPLLVDAVARVAGSRSRADWAGRSELGRDPSLAAHWAKVAALEHASVASFARFAQQLLALGAPPRLVRDVSAAAVDEIEHARLAYGLASAYGGEPVGPGRLDLSGVTLAASWREVVRGLIAEACVGETLGVAEAMAAAEGASDPVVRAVLDRIAADELRHAQLAWRSLAWLLGVADERDRGWALALLERTIAAVGAQISDGEGSDRVSSEGVLTRSQRARVHVTTVARVLAPVARSLGCSVLGI